VREMRGKRAGLPRVPQSTLPSPPCGGWAGGGGGSEPVAISPTFPRTELGEQTSDRKGAPTAQGNDRCGEPTLAEAARTSDRCPVSSPDSHRAIHRRLRCLRLSPRGRARWGAAPEPEQAARDQRWTAFLEGEGFRVLRFWNTDVLNKNNIEGVLERIWVAVGAAGSVDSQPVLHQRERRRPRLEPEPAHSVPSPPRGRRTGWGVRVLRHSKTR